MSFLNIAEGWRLQHKAMRGFQTNTNASTAEKKSRASRNDSALPSYHLSSCHAHSQTLPLALKPTASIIARWPSSGNSLFLKFSLLPSRSKQQTRARALAKGHTKLRDFRRGLAWLLLYCS